MAWYTSTDNLINSPGRLPVPGDRLFATME